MDTGDYYYHPYTLVEQSMTSLQSENFALTTKLELLETEVKNLSKKIQDRDNIILDLKIDIDKLSEQHKADCRKSEILGDLVSKVFTAASNAFAEVSKEPEDLPLPDILGNFTPGIPTKKRTKSENCECLCFCLNNNNNNILYDNISSSSLFVNSNEQCECLCFCARN